MKNATHASMVGVAFSCPSRRRIFLTKKWGQGYSPLPDGAATGWFPYGNLCQVRETAGLWSNLFRATANYLSSLTVGQAAGREFVLSGKKRFPTGISPLEKTIS